MSPTIKNNSYVLIFSTHNQRYRVNDIVICNHPEYQTIVKRICMISENGDVYLSGDSPKSTQSSMIGWQSKANLTGKVCLTLPA